MAPKAKEKAAPPPPPPPPADEPVEEQLEEPTEPPEPTEDELTELSTGLKLPLRGLDVGRIWAEGVDYIAQGEIMSELLHFEKEFPSAPQRAIVCDFHLYNLVQAKALCLTQVQGAVFHAIMSSILNMMRCPDPAAKMTPQDMPIGPAQCFNHFQELIIQHSVSAPPQRLDIFRVSEARMLTDFVSTTLFKHFLLYQFCISMPQDAQTLRFRLGLQRPLPAPDLNTALLQPVTEEPPGVGTSGADADGAAADELHGGAGEEASAEDDEVSRLVEEKLRETEAALQAKLEAREEAFRQKLAARPDPKAKAKK